jgi:glutathione synthase/RimK-type ligase-like ATP-grasp enzyme
VNPAASMGSNGSKPYQAQLIARHGFAVPDTIVTNDPDRVRDFRARHGRIIYKSASGIRSIVREFDDDDLDRLDRIRWCPTQFQAFVPGTDVRVHVVDTEVFATEIDSDATDYRYATREGTKATLRAITLDADVADRCVSLARDLRLPFAGIDLRRRGGDGAWVCFEVNPSPGFSFYESRTGQPIARAVARYLAATA